MSFLKNVMGGLKGMVDLAHANISPFKVGVYKPDEYAKIPVRCQEGSMILYKRHGCFDCILAHCNTTEKVFSLFRLTSESEAMSLFYTFVGIVNALLRTSSSVCQESMLQKICDITRANPLWTPVHVAAFVGLFEVFKSEELKLMINTQCTKDGVSPIMSAIMGKQQQCIQELVALGAAFDLQTSEGETVYHLAVNIEPTLLTTMTFYDQSGIINWKDNKGQTPLALACEKDLSKAVEILLEGGADPCICGGDVYPIHVAVQNSNEMCVELLCEKNNKQVFLKDKKYGGTPLHWAKTKQVIEILCRHGADLNAKSDSGQTPLHVMLEKNRAECIMELLCFGADTRIMDKEGNTPLHVAVMNDDTELVRTFTVFGADVNLKNAKNQSARHIVATGKSKNKDSILFILHVSGAMKCAQDVKGCQKGCCFENTYNGKQDPSMESMMEADKYGILDEILACFPEEDIDMATVRNKALEAGFPEDVPDGCQACSPAYRVLCLDGGGIRGLVMTQMLMAIQDAAGIPIKDCFDWIGGTSTGGMLALGIATGMSLAYMKGLYFRLKDEVFVGKRPYNTEPFENMLKREFGETMVMTDIKSPKVVAMGVFGDRFPTDLHLFRSYHPTLQRDFIDDKNLFQSPKPPDEQLVWHTARSSGAAPTYFRSSSQFIDGGLIANNPTLDVMTEIHEYNVGLKLRNRHQEVKPLACVVSLGCGRIPVVPNSYIDVYIPEGLVDLTKVVKGAAGLMSVLIEQATIAEGRPVDRARSWCSMLDVPFARFSPRLSEDVSLDCHENNKLIKMMWETQCYIVANQHRINRVGKLLRKYYDINKQGQDMASRSGDGIGDESLSTAGKEKVEEYRHDSASSGEKGDSA